MVQTRLLQYGAPVQSSDMPTALSNVMAPGRLVGMEFSVAAADQIGISPGSVLMPNGIVISEKQPKTLQINNTAFATSYTVTYKLQSTNVIGGAPANLTLLTGIVKQSNLTDSVVLGWILYPGNSLALDTSYFRQPEPIRVQRPQALLHDVFLPPFSTAIRPEAERPGSSTVKSVRFSNLNATQSQVAGFAGMSARVLGATVVTDSVPIAASSANNDTFSVSKSFVVTGTITTGSAVISNISDTSRITMAQGIGNGNNGIQSGATIISVPTSNSVTMSSPATQTVTGPITLSDTLFSLSTATTGVVAGQPTPLSRTIGLAPAKFLVGPADALTVGVKTSTIPPAGTASGEIDVLMEMPGRSGVWQEALVTYSNETAWQFFNSGNATATYDFRLPFVVTGEGQPNKLVTRLNVDANCLVTFGIVVGGKTLALSPNTGTVANTGGLITNELSIPDLAGVQWKPGTMAYVDVQIQAQPGGSAAFAFVGLTLEDAPYLLFV